MPPFTFVSRSEWGALPAQGELGDLPKPVLKVLMTKTRTLPCNSDEECKLHMRKLQAFHMGKGMEDIAYNFVITPDAKVYEGRGWYKVAPTPAERPEFENQALVIAHIGDFPVNEPKRIAMDKKMYKLIDEGMNIFALNPADVNFILSEEDPWIDNTVVSESMENAYVLQMNMYAKGVDLAEYAVENQLLGRDHDLRLLDNWIDDRKFELHISKLDEGFDESLYTE